MVRGGIICVETFRKNNYGGLVKVRVKRFYEQKKREGKRNKQKIRRGV